MKNTKIVDTFWENFNASRCKTAMLAISVLVFFGVVLMELMGGSNLFMQYLAVSILGYWTGRTTKQKDKHISFEDYQLTNKNE